MSDKPDIRIYKCETKMALNGQEIERRELTVAGNDLVECRVHFDQIWKGETK